MIDASNLARHFPVHAIVGPGLQVLQLGSALKRLAGELPLPVCFTSLFEVERPAMAAVDLNQLRSLGPRLCLLRFKPNGMRIRAEFVASPHGHAVMLGSVGVSATAELTDLRLTLNDFTAHDPTVDFLMAVTTHRASLDDLRQLTIVLEARSEELEQGNQKLAEATAEARRASEMKSRFLSNMSHEIRTPLNAIAGFSKLLLEKAYPEDREEFLTAIHTSAELLVSLVGQVLDLAKIEAGHLEVTISPFDPHQLIEQIMGPTKERARERGLNCSWRTEIPDRIWLMGDVLRIQQVALNLLGNSVKFTDRGEIELLAKWHDDYLHFEVRDTGPGIHPHELEELFKPFVQGGDSDRHKEGTGLGLAISRNLVELLGGSLTAISDGKSGSVFRFAVPAPRIEPLVKNPEIIPYPPPFSSSVLIVDDNEINLLLAMKLLEREGYTVQVARNGEQALAIIEQRVPDTVLMDIQMPGLDGLETTRLLRSRGIQVPVIALTANAMQGDRECCLAAGMDGYLSKPFDVKSLQSLMRDLHDR